VLAEELRTTDHADPDFPQLLRAVRDARVFTGGELAELIGLSRARLYELLSES
jgi:alkylated DNA nucleotide flippase Atl1